jgi:hypothetical protein
MRKTQMEGSSEPQTKERNTVMISKKSIVITALGVAAGGLLVVTQGAWTDQAADPLKLEGAWVAKVPGTALVWTYTYAPSDQSGRCAALQGTLHVGIDPTLAGAFPDAQYLTPLVGEAAITSPKTGSYTALSHAMKVGAQGPEVVYTLVSYGRIVKTGPGQVGVKHHFHIYLPSQDADGDGIPRQSQTPADCIQVHSLDTRIPMFNSFSKNCGD